MSEHSWFDRLHAKAEALLHAEPKNGASDSEAVLDLKTLLKEFKIYEAELQLQNGELRHSENHLQQALRSYQALFHALPLAALVVDHLGLVHQANERAASLFGFRSSAVFEGHSLLRTVARRDQARVAEALATARQDRSLQVDAVWIPSDLDHGIEAELSVTQLPLDYHLDRYLLITVLDRTELYAAQRRAKLLESVIDSMDARVAVYDRAGVCTFANARLAADSCLTVEQMLGARRDVWMSLDQALAQERKDATVMITDRATVEEESIETIGGSTLQLQRHRVPVYDDAGRSIGVGDFAADVTEIRRKERQLDLVMAAYSISRDGILTTDSKNQITSVNAAFEQITGYTEREVRGKNPRMLSSGRHDRHFFNRMWQGINENGRWEGEIWNRRKNGEIFPEWLSISCVPDEAQGTVNYVGVFSDISKRKADEEEIEQLAFYDILTGLANRYLLADRAALAIQSAAREKTNCALVYFDLDHFKQVNDTHGHTAGDALLLQVAQRVSQLIRDKDTLSRLGGDEFVLLLNAIAIPDMQTRLEDLLAQVNLPYLIDGKESCISASFGVAVYPTDGETYHALLQHADTAMYMAKEEGRNTIRFFNEQMASRARAKLSMENELRQVLNNKELELVYQPQLALDDMRLIGCEALLRWHSNELGEVAPANFIPVAEQIGRIEEIGEWVMNVAFETAAELQKQPFAPRMAINLSAKQVRAEHFLERLSQALERSGASARGIELEITESLIMKEADWTLGLMKKLKSMGFEIAIDDFGTGYSSLAYLNWMPVDTLKIDRAFVQDVSADSNHAKVCRSIIGLAKSLGIQTVAEGVEQLDQYNFLRDAGCDVIQGFYTARPMSREQLLSCVSNACVPAALRDRRGLEDEHSA